MHVFKAIVETDGGTLVALVAQHSAGQSLEALFGALYTDHSSLRRQAACIVVRPDVRDQFTTGELEAALLGQGTASPFLQALRDATSEAKWAFDRVLDTPVIVLFASPAGLHLSANVNPFAPNAPFIERGVTDDEVLLALRENEMLVLMERSRALMPVIPNSFYRAPSGRLARAFLRVGNLQFSRHSIDAICFWLLPHVLDCHAVLVDTWSISSLAFDLAGIIGAMRGGAPVPVEMLSQYQDGSPERSALAAEALDRLAAELEAALPPEIQRASAKVACVMSATHSGKLAGILNELVEMSGLELSLSSVALFQMGPDLGIPSLSDISGTLEFRPLDPNEEVGKTIVEVDSQSYFPLGHNDVELVVRERHARAAKALLEAITEPGLLSVHRDHKTDGPPRHHAFHIDTTVLIRSEVFRAKLANQLLALEPAPTVIITPLHAAAHELGVFAASILARVRSTAHYEHSSLAIGPTSSDPADVALFKVLTAIGPDESVLVLDDAFITGTRLNCYHNRLREMKCRARLHYHVAVARPCDPAEWKAADTMLGWRPKTARAGFERNTVTATFELCLPHWLERECPWCTELQVYNAIIDRGGELPPQFAQRRTRLIEGRETGLMHDAVLQAASDPPIVLAQGSIFAPDGATQADVFAAVASALQTLRTVSEPDLPKLGPRRFPLSTVLLDREYLLDTYTDSVVRAAFIRDAIADELVYADGKNETERQALVAGIVASHFPHWADLGHELILAAALGKGVLSGVAREALGKYSERDEALKLFGVAE